MPFTWYVFELEVIMKRAALAGLLLFAAVFIIGVLFGWPYSMAIGCLVVGLNLMINRRR